MADILGMNLSMAKVVVAQLVSDDEVRIGGTRVVQSTLQSECANKLVNAGAFFVRAAHYKCADYAWRWAE